METLTKAQHTHIRTLSTSTSPITNSARSTNKTTPTPLTTVNEHALFTQLDLVDKAERALLFHRDIFSVPEPRYYGGTRPNNTYDIIRAISGLHSRAAFEYNYASRPQPEYNAATGEITLVNSPLLPWACVRDDMHVARYKHYYLEINDYLISRICPADLLGVPCLWDELPGGCDALRLCRTKRQFPQPFPTGRGSFSFDKPEACDEHNSGVCEFVHDVMITCRSIQKQIGRSGDPSRQFQQVRCKESLAGKDCIWAHECEGVRTWMAFYYEEHCHQAKQRGARHRTAQYLKKTKQMQHYWKPKSPNLNCLGDLDISSNETIRGVTFHGLPLTMTYYQGTNIKSVADYQESLENLKTGQAHNEKIAGQKEDVNQRCTPASCPSSTFRRANNDCRSSSPLAELNIGPQILRRSVSESCLAQVISTNRPW